MTSANGEVFTERRLHCDGHQEVVVSMARIEEKLDSMNEKLAIFQEHIKESVPVRDSVNELMRFKGGVTKALWAFFTVIMGLIAKAFGFNGQ